MADSYSVKAVLSAKDSGFTSTIKNAGSALSSLGDKIKNGFAFGVLTGMGQQAFSAITSGVSGLIGEINDSSKAWQTFEGNMANFGKTSKEIDAVKKELQSFAETTVYSSSEMASTYAQLEAVGVGSMKSLENGTTGLVKGFGGLAAAAENPSQAMKTLSQQATQMAAKPKVAWEDFKLMLEQSPAGMAAVAKEMGMSTDKLITKIQSGSVKTEDFFAAVEKAGTSEGFSKMATQAKTMDQAMDGLKESIGNKLLPAWQLLSKYGIKAIDSVANVVSKIDGQKIYIALGRTIYKAKQMWQKFAPVVAKVSGEINKFGKRLKKRLSKKNLSEVFEKAMPIWNGFKEIAAKVGETVKSLGNMLLKFLNKKNLSAAVESMLPYWEMFKKAVIKVSDAIQKLAGFLGKHSEKIMAMLPHVVALVGAYKGFKLVKSLVPAVASFASSIGSLAAKVGGGLASKLFGLSGAQKEVGETSGSSAKQILAGAAAMVALGVAVLLISAGFWLLADAAIRVSDAGGVAIGVLAGLVVAVVALALGFGFLMKSITASPAQIGKMAVAMIALGVAIVLVAAGFWIMADAAVRVANGGGLAAGVMLGMIAGIAILVFVLSKCGAGLTGASVGMLAFGATALMVGAALALSEKAIYALSVLVVALGVVFVAVAYVIGNAIVSIIQAISGLVVSLGEAISQIVSSIGTAVSQIVLSIGEAASQMMLAFGNMALSISEAISGVISSFSGLITSISDGVSQIVLAIGTTLVNIFQTAGESIALVIQSISDGFSAIGETIGGIVESVGTAISTVVDSLSGGISTIIDSVAGAIESVGTSAKNAGEGFKLVADGIVAIADLSLGDTITALGTVGDALRKVSKYGDDLVTAGAGLTTFNEAITNVSSSSDGFATSLDNMVVSVKTLETELNNAATNAKTSGTKLGTGFVTGAQTGMKKAVVLAGQTVSQINTKLRSGYSGAYSAGAYISQGFANGMLSCLATVRSAATQLAAAAQKAIEAKAKIASPSKVATKDGEFWGEGWVNGILSKVKDAWNAAEQLVSFPAVDTPNLALAYSGGVSSDYEYYRNAEYVVSVPLSVDGREFAKATATYTQEELDKRQIRDSRRHGRL